MVDTAIHAGSVLFAIVGGTGAGILAVLLWRALRGSPVGTIVGLLTVAMSAMIVYHALLFVLELESFYLNVLRSVLQTAVAIFLWLAIATHRHVETSVVEG